MAAVPIPYIPFDRIIIPTTARPGEWFQCKPEGGGWHHAWNVTKANEILIARASQSRLVRAVLSEANAKTVLESGTETDAAYLASDRCDPRRPIVSVVIDGREWIIDGWHRVRRAVLMHWTEIPTFTLTNVEDLDCRICRCCRPRSLGILPTGQKGRA